MRVENRSRFRLCVRSERWFSRLAAGTRSTPGGNDKSRRAQFMSARSAFAGSQFSHAGRPALYLVPDTGTSFSGAVAPSAAPADAYAAAGSPSAVRRAHTSAQAPLRLTRRGRFVFFGLPLILL